MLLILYGKILLELSCRDAPLLFPRWSYSVNEPELRFAIGRRYSLPYSQAYSTALQDLTGAQVTRACHKQRWATARYCIVAHILSKPGASEPSLISCDEVYSKLVIITV
jgi:hypothetical protein